MSMERLKVLAAQLLAAQKEVEAAEETLSQAKAKLRRVAEEDMPEFLDEVGLHGGVKVEGGTLELDEVLTVSTSADRRPAICEWLRSVGHGSAVKRMVTVSFGKDSELEAAKLRHRLEGEAFLAREVLDINTATLKSVVRQRLEDGQSVPMDLVGAHLVRKAHIKPPRAQRQFEGE